MNTLMRLAICVPLLVGCASLKPAVVASKNCHNFHPETSAQMAEFDRRYGPALRQSDAYKAAIMPGAPCDAVFNLVHPLAWRQAEETRRLKPYDDLLESIAWSGATWPSTYYPGYYHRHH